MTTKAPQEKNSLSTPRQPLMTLLKDRTPFVRYGDAENKQAPKLYPIDGQIPDDAVTVSPIYLLTSEEIEEQDQLETGYEVPGDKSIAKTLQDSCQKEGRVITPVHIESDRYGSVRPTVIFDWLGKFTDSVLNVSPISCTYFYSGSRSIHAHVPLLVVGNDEREWLKIEAINFCNETEADLDLSVFDRHSMFRLPGVVHAKTGTPKVKIHYGAGEDEVNEAAATDSIWHPSTYVEVLSSVFETDKQRQGPKPGQQTNHWLAKLLGDARMPIPREQLKIPIHERTEKPTNSQPQWKAYNHKEFSPYSGGNKTPRSVAIVQVVGGEFARKDVREGATLVPAYFRAAVSAHGNYKKYNQYAPLQLSKPDYQKWDFQIGDNVVIIGSRSTRSRIFTVSDTEASEAAGILLNKGRTAALQWLADCGYDTGKSGFKESAAKSQPDTTPKLDRSLSSEVKNDDTRAARLQQAAEEGDIEDLTHDERSAVANRLLQSEGWQGAWRWFADQYGDRFSPEITWKNFESLVKYYDDLSHTDIPPRP
jgi:hypothetical protein